MRELGALPAARQSRLKPLLQSPRNSATTASAQHRFAIKGTEYKLRAKEKQSNQCPSVRRGTHQSSSPQRSRLAPQKGARAQVPQANAEHASAQQAENTEGDVEAQDPQQHARLDYRTI